MGPFRSKWKEQDNYQAQTCTENLQHMNNSVVNFREIQAKI